MNDRASHGDRLIFGYVTTLFFMWGAITSVNDVLIPAVKSIFSLTDTESFLTQFAFFLAYGVVSLPAALILQRVGARLAISCALAVMIAGCLLMPLATTWRTYPLVLVALFVIASGITLLQVAANPLAAVLGPPDRSHFRLVLSQAFNSLGTVIGPFVAAHTLLRGGLFDGGEPTEAKIAESLSRIDLAYGFLAIVIAALAAVLYRSLRTLPRAESDQASAGQFWSAVKSRWALLGAMAIFLYVGAEVAIGSAMVNFLEQPDVFAVTAAQAGSFVSLYWLGAMVGRFAGSAMLVRMSATSVLAGAAAAAMLLCIAVTRSTGVAAGTFALAIGLFNSVMFPVIFTLTMERSKAAPAAVSGLLCMAIVGGAFVPLAFAGVADATGSRAAAFVVPALCYASICVFALIARHAHRTRAVDERQLQSH